MKVPHRQRLEITLDVFRGCAHHCSGCMIDKALGGELNDLAELQALIEEMTAAGYVAFDLGMGPTDYMSADNGADVFEHPVVQALGQMFEQVTINAAFLDKDFDNYEKMCQEIDAAFPNKAIRFLIPAAPDFFRTPKFGQMIEDKLTFCKDTLQVAYLNEAGFVINCTQGTVGPDFEERMKAGFAIDFPVDKDDILNIPYGRSKSTDLLTSESVKKISHRISSFYSELSGEDERRRNPDLCYHTGTMVNLLYSDGKLYWVPFLKDDYAFLNEAFVIPRPWTMENLLAARSKALGSSLEYLKGTACESCVYLSSCSEKGITTIMEKLSIRECLVGLEYAYPRK